MNKKLYRIGEVSQILGIHRDTLRNWERDGIVTPIRVGNRNDRRYTEEQLSILKNHHKGLHKKHGISNKLFHIFHNWKVAHKGIYSPDDGCFYDTIYYCDKCGKLKRIHCLYDIKKAGWTIKEFKKEFLS